MNPSKQDILAAAIAAQKSVIHDLEKRTREIMATDGNVNEEEYDSTEQSIKSSLIDEAEVLGDEITYVRNQLTELEKLKHIDTKCDTVRPGAVVVTNHGIFFVSASVEGFKVGPARVFGISTRAPLYDRMKGRKAGEKFKYEELSYTIKDIY